MQEISLNFTLHRIDEGDEPPKDGYYLVIEPKIAVIAVSVERMWWDSKNHAWKLDEDSESLFMPADFWGYTWTNDWLTEVLK